MGKNFVKKRIVFLAVVLLLSLLLPVVALAQPLESQDGNEKVLLNEIAEDVNGKKIDEVNFFEQLEELQGETTENILPLSDTYTLNVINGTGSGIQSIDDSLVITADPAPVGMEFYRWGGEYYKLVGDTRQESTTVRWLFGTDITVEALYKPIGEPEYTLEMIGGSVGEGTYIAGDVVDVIWTSLSRPESAGTDAWSAEFLGWSSDKNGVFADELAEHTTYTMTADDTVITANYAERYSLSIVDGSIVGEDGTKKQAGYFFEGDIVNIVWDSPITSMGVKFLEWISNQGGIFGDTLAKNTTYVMTADDTVIEAKHAHLCSIHVDGGVIVGDNDDEYESRIFAEGDIIRLKAKIPNGKKFVKWTSDVGVTFVDEFDPNTTFVLPSNMNGINIKAEYQDEYVQRTLIDPATGISITGHFSVDADIIVSSDIENVGAGAELLVKQKNGELVILKDISSTGYNGGEIIVSIPVGAEHNGKTLTMLHGLSDGRIEKKDVVVKNGSVTETFSSLSPYAVAKKQINSESNIAPKTDDKAEVVLWFVMSIIAIAVLIPVVKKKLERYSK